MLGRLFILCALSQLGSCITQRPIIGIVTQELEDFLKQSYPGFDSYIASGYVKAIESAGGRVIPIFIGKSEEYYRKVAESINGVLIPGGGAHFSGTNNYYSTSKYMYRIALELNEKGVYFPVYGVCLGFQVLFQFANNDVDVRKRCDLKYVNMPINFVSGYRKSNLFKSLPRSIAKTLHSDNSTVHNHVWCNYPDDFTKGNLDKDWKILATTNDRSGVAFISAYEHKKYPIFATVFHPEKNTFEWQARFNFPRSAKELAAAHYFYERFVDLAKKNDNHFANPTEEEENLIYNFSPAYSQVFASSSFTQTYLFKTKCPGF